MQGGKERDPKREYENPRSRKGIEIMFGLVPFGSNKGLARREDSFDRLFDMFNEPFFAGFSGGSFKVDVKDGVLTVKLPKCEQAKPAGHEIHIN